jgi:hypothetical protein
MPLERSLIGGSGMINSVSGRPLRPTATLNVQIALVPAFL